MGFQKLAIPERRTTRWRADLDATGAKIGLMKLLRIQGIEMEGVDVSLETYLR